MRFTDLFIKRPVLATVVNLIILIAGYQAIRSINVRQYPRSDLSVITVTTLYYGADSDLVRGFLTTPLEQSIASADGIDYMESMSQPGSSTINVHLKLNYDPNAALAQIQTKVEQVRNQLPPASQLPVLQITSTDNQFASMYLSFFSKDLGRNQITDYLTRVVQPKLSAISGVQSAQILGARTFAMRVWMKPERMTALNVSPTDIQNALQNNNYLAGVGQTKGSMVAINLITNTNLQSAEEFKQMVIKQQNGAMIRLQDVADIDLGAEDYNSDVRFSGSVATFMGIFVLPTANTLDVIKRVRVALPDIERELPTGMRMAIPYDSTLYIQNAIDDVIRTLTETILIVIIVIFLFMGSFRSVLIPIVAIPLSLVGAFFLMLMFGFTLNLLTLLAIVLAVGLVVDDAIVVVENVERHLQEGMKPFDAAIKGARELLGPIVAMTISLATVYAPIGLQGGLSGSLFREFAFTLSGAVAISGVVALTLSPMMASKLLKQGMAERGLAGWITRRFDGLRASYANTLTWSLGYWQVICIMALLVICLSVPFYLMSAKEPAPREDQGVIFGIVQTPPNATLEQNMLFTEQMNEIYKSYPETAQTFQLTFATQGFSGMVAKPWNERNRTMEEVLVDVNHKLSQIPGVQIFATTPSPLPGGTNFPVDLVITSTAEPREMNEFAQQLVGAAFKSGKFVFADSDLKYDLPEANIVFDRDKVASMGLNLGQVGGDLAILLGGGYTNYFSIQGRSYKVIPQVKRINRLTTDDLKNLYVTGPNGQPIQLSTFADIKTTVQPRSLNRFQQLNSATIQGLPNKFAGATTDDALKVLEQEAAKILPKGYTIDYTGESRQLRKEGDTFLTTLALAGILIYLVLAAQFESFRDPLIILLGSVPLGLTGALAVTFLGRTTINAYSYVGLVTLVGLVCKNGILIVEFANKLQEGGLGKFQAIVEAAATRLRPILMTSVATVAGHTPLILAHGPGAGARNSIGWVLVTGMIIGTCFTLFVLPAVYLLVAKDRSKAQQRQGDFPQIAGERKLHPALA
jgi:multidrug efflux pump